MNGPVQGGYTKWRQHDDGVDESLSQSRSLDPEKRLPDFLSPTKLVTIEDCFRPSFDFDNTPHLNGQLHTDPSPLSVAGMKGDNVQVPDESLPHSAAQGQGRERQASFQEWDINVQPSQMSPCGPEAYCGGRALQAVVPTLSVTAQPDTSGGRFDTPMSTPLPSPPGASPIKMEAVLKDLDGVLSEVVPYCAVPSPPLTSHNGPSRSPGMLSMPSISPPLQSPMMSPPSLGALCKAGIMPEMDTLEMPSAEIPIEKTPPKAADPKLLQVFLDDQKALHRTGRMLLQTVDGRNIMLCHRKLAMLLQEHSKKTPKLDSPPWEELIGTAGLFDESELFALDATCWHMGGPLVEADIEDIDGQLCLKCPWHFRCVTMDSGEHLYVNGVQPDGSDRVVVNAGARQRTHQVVLEGHWALIYVGTPSTGGRVAEVKKAIEEMPEGDVRIKSDEFAYITTEVVRNQFGSQAAGLESNAARVRRKGAASGGFNFSTRC